MSIGFNGANSLRRTTGLLDFNADYTIGALYRLTAIAGSDRTLVHMSSNTSNHNSSEQIAVVNAGGGLMKCVSFDSGGAVNGDGTGGTFATGTWFGCFMRRSGSQVDFVRDGTVECGFSVSPSGRAASAQHTIGRWVNIVINGWNGEIVGIRGWQRALSDAECATESRRISPATWRDLRFFCPLLQANDYRDFVAQSDWTFQNTPTTSDNPPYPWGVPRHTAVDIAVQRAFPNADVSDGNWQNELGNNTNLFASVDEPFLNTSDFIESPVTPVNEAVKLGLGSLSTPKSGDVKIFIWHQTT